MLIPARTMAVNPPKTSSQCFLKKDGEAVGGTGFVCGGGACCGIGCGVGLSIASSISYRKRLVKPWYNYHMQKQSLKPIDLSKKLLPYENKWVALSKDQKEILGFGNSLKEAERQAKKSKREYVFLKIPPFNLSYVPTSA